MSLNYLFKMGLLLKPKRKLLDIVREKICLKHYSLSIESIYKTSPLDMQ